MFYYGKGDKLSRPARWMHVELSDGPAYSVGDRIAPGAVARGAT